MHFHDGLPGLHSVNGEQDLELPIDLVPERRRKFPIGPRGACVYQLAMEALRSTGAAK